ncbi:MAG TPA: hypothetical protein VJZ70_04450 [Limnochordia bacterium]|nr:hypothetical protein [Limnochordia bacterium]
MRRMIFIFLVVVAILVLGVRFFVNERLISESPPGLEINLVEYSTPSSPMARLQDSVDDLSRAAIQGQWSQASRTLQQLDEAWQTLVFGKNPQLETEKEIEMSIQSLYYNVWKQDEQAVLATAQKLSLLLEGLAS